MAVIAPPPLAASAILLMHNRCRIKSLHTSEQQFRLKSLRARSKLKEERDDVIPDSVPLALEQADDKSRFEWVRVLPHVLTAAMANFMFGYHIGIINGPLETISRDLGIEGDTIAQGLVVSIFVVGAFMGSIGGGILSDTIGRRRTFQIDMIPLVVGPALSANAHSLDEMLLGRLLVGLGIGVNASLVPLYISEIAPTEYRGALGSLCQLGTCIGIIVVLLVGIPVEYDPHWWRSMFWIGAVPAVLLIFAMQFAAESPRWLAKVGRWEEAKKTMEGLWEKSKVERAMEELMNEQSIDEQDQASWSEIFSGPSFKVTTIGGTLFFLQQFAGINGVLYFSSATFHDAGINNSMTASVAVSVVNLIGALVASYLMDREGRRKLLISSYLGMALSMGMLVLALQASVGNDLSHFLSVAGTLMYMFTFALGAGPVTGIIIPELCSTRARAKTVAFSLCVHWVCNFLIGLLFLEMVELFGLAAVYTSFGAVSLITVSFANKYIIETKGKSLEEIQLLLNLE